MFSNVKVLVLCLWLGGAMLALAQDAPKPDPVKTDVTKKKKAEPSKDGPAKPETKAELAKETFSETEHSITVNGGPLKYKATAGNLLLKGDEDKAKASVFFIAYQKAGVKDPSQRPITFAFNGGPGSSSVWLHLGAFGPRRVDLGAKEELEPPYRLVDNELSILDLTDLVFIDPVSTGYSRPAPGRNPKEFQGVNEDVRDVGEFIRLYVTRFGRWDSPKFLAGESYGTIRAAGLVSHLQNDGMNFNGVILVSSILNYETVSNSLDMNFVFFLPSFTATAWYHKKLSGELQSDLRKTLAEVEKFAVDEYTPALMKGSKLPTEDRNRIAAKLVRYTGLSEEYVKRHNLRISQGAFFDELLRSEGKKVGRFDSRFLGKDLSMSGDQQSPDPSYTAVQGPYTALLNRYMREELKYTSDMEYRILKGYGWSLRDANMAPGLRSALSKNRGLQVFVANGYYDLATPFFATKYTMDHLGADASVLDRVHMKYYEAGHMMYVHPPSHLQFKKDLSEFYDEAVRKN